MNNYVKATPVAGAAFAAVALDQLWLLGVAVGLIAVVAVAVRIGYRRGRRLGDRLYRAPSSARRRPSQRRLLPSWH
jgi:hypothetical protein